MKKIVYLLATLLLAVGCTQQDPLTDAPANIKDAVDPGQKLDGPKKPVSREFFYFEIKGNQSISFVEGVEKSIEFESRIMLEDAPEHEIKILNLPEGSSFDEKTKVFTWEPPEDWVRGAETFSTFTLQAQISTLEEPISTERKNFDFIINRNLERPEITSVSINKNELMEGERGYITLIVNDPNSAAGLRPTIHAFSKDRFKNSGAGYLVIKEAMPTGNKNEWTIEMTMDLSQVDVTNSYESLSLSFMVISSTGTIASSEETVTFKVYHRPVELIWGIDTKDEIEVTRGQKNTVYVPVKVTYSESEEIVATWKTMCSTLPGIVSCTCKKGFAASEVMCKIEITPHPTKKKYAIDLEATVNNRYKRGVRAITRRKTIKLKVIDSRNVCKPETPANPQPPATPAS